MKKLLLLLLVTISFSVTAQDIYLHCGKLIDTKSGEVLTEKTIIVSGNKIVSVENGYVNPKKSEDSIVDLKDKTVMPGLIDLHVHIESETNPRSFVAKYTDNEADVAFQSTVYAKRTLMAGFTTVRDLGGSGVNIALRKAIDAGKVDGPRIFTAGKIIASTGGHGDATNGAKTGLLEDPGPDEGVVNSAADARKAVRQRYKNGADVIKITATGGVLSVAKNGSNSQFTVDELEAVVETAKDYGMLTAAHAHGDEGMQRAVKAGIKTIEHGTFMSEVTMDLMKQKQSYLVPTISAGKYVAEKAKIDGFYPAIIVPKALEVGPQLQGTFTKAYKRGVPIAFGTDAGVFPHGENGKEFRYMEEAGMPAIETIQSATITNAKLLNSENELGEIAAGFFADIVATNDDPTKKISTMENIVFVMKNGVIYKK
ncbi:metal-dependent hydrolase family protein [Winogradskyella immobilis]|uniref:Amidohydrolase family protein n=1 Tax=Winogradskyella immobilis TaxID=2816852 RepID=A0ABS8ELU8_9FLAO|nr:amidohydrolase family protein [Winogradskyella immobilis]MCC1483817.1 amidohydrolase family protein [Winogradskyella immobilis]MCG0015911.1 amidohydrolase family protein [Winogradskyella immobilis]